MSLWWQLSNMLNGQICIKKRNIKLKGGSWEDRQGGQNHWEMESELEFQWFTINGWVVSFLKL
jgi:hypothetical protein